MNLDELNLNSLTRGEPDFLDEHDGELWSLDDFIDVSADASCSFPIDHEVIDSRSDFDDIASVPPPHGATRSAS